MARRSFTSIARQFKWMAAALALALLSGAAAMAETRSASCGQTLAPARSAARKPGWRPSLRFNLSPLRSCRLRSGEQLRLPLGMTGFGGPRSPLAQWMVRSIEPETCRALNAVIASNKRGAATFDADGTLWKKDVGEGFFRWMMAHHHYPPEREPALRKAWRSYNAGTLANTAMYELMVTGMAGMKELEVGRLARRYFDSLHKPSIYQPMAALVSALGENGFAPWVVSGSCYWVVAAGARHFGIPPSRVIGLKVRVDGEGRLTDEVLRPVPWQEGKAQRILQEVGSAPVIAAGNSRGDLQMLKIASDLPLAINPDPDLMPQAGHARFYVNTFSNADTLHRWLGSRPSTPPIRRLP